MTNEIVAEAVTFFTRDGSRLAGDLTRPESGDAARGPAVLLCQGLSGVRQLVMPEVANAFAAKGIASLRFNYPRLEADRRRVATTGTSEPVGINDLIPVQPRVPRGL
jgi:predicted alpha/beta-hydrolase family hydrolase